MPHLYDKDAPYEHDTLIKGVFFDNDDVLYKAPKNQDAYHKLAAVRAVQAQVPYMENRQLLRLLELGKEQGKGSLDIFVERFNADPEQLRKDHYKHLTKLTNEYPEFFKDPETAYAEIGKMRIAGIETHIITHGNPSWTEHTTSKGERSLSDFFSHKGWSYTCKDEMSANSGKESVDIYHAALDKMNISKNIESRGQGFAMVEDTVKNLIAAKELGMMTIFINRKDLPMAQIPDYVDVVVPNSMTATQAVMDSNACIEETMRLNQEKHPSFEYS